MAFGYGASRLVAARDLAPPTDGEQPLPPRSHDGEEGVVAANAPLASVNLLPLMRLTTGSPEIVIALLDGPVSKDHPDLEGAKLRSAADDGQSWCCRSDSPACSHGTFVAGVLTARRGSAAPAICPGCTLLVHPIFSERAGADEALPSATPQQLADAIVVCVDAGASLLNVSAAIVPSSLRADRQLQQALDHAARRGALVVAAAGNQGIVGGTALTAHPWVIPVVAYAEGRPMALSNLGSSMGRRGLGAPGEVTSLTPDGQPHTRAGTSCAAPFVTGAVALLRSEFPRATAAHVKSALFDGHGRRSAIAPPLFDAWAAYQVLRGKHEERALA